MPSTGDYVQGGTKLLGGIVGLFVSPAQAKTFTDSAVDLEQTIPGAERTPQKEADKPAEKQAPDKAEEKSKTVPENPAQKFQAGEKY